MADVEPKYVNQLEKDSHDNGSNTVVKRSGLYGWNSSSLVWERIQTSSGIIQQGISLPKYDYVTVDYPDAVSEIYTFKSGGSGGTTVATITLTYTDSTKAALSIVAKT